MASLKEYRKAKLASPSFKQIRPTVIKTDIDKANTRRALKLELIKELKEL